MTTPRVLSALDIARDKDKYDLDTKPERWILGPPFDRLDVRPGRVILLGAPPGVGKTTLSLQLVSDALELYPQLRCVVGNVETAPPVLLDKLLARFAAVPFEAVMNREFLIDERARIDAALRDRADLLGRIGFLEQPYSVPNLFDGMKAFNARLAVVDYIQRFSAGDREDRAKLDAVMSQIRLLVDLSAAVIVISSVARQKSRNGSSTYGGLTMAAFRGSAELEFGADSAYLLHSDPATGIAKLECVKERFGTPRDIPLRFHGEFQRFEAGDILDGFEVAPARASAGAIEPHLTGYEQSLIARDVSEKYWENLLRDTARLIAEVPIVGARDLRREIVEPWFANAISGGMKARTRNRYREAVLSFANWCRDASKLREHDLDKLPKADPKADPVRPRRSLTEDEFSRLLTVARERPLAFRQSMRKGKQTSDLSAEVVNSLEELGRERVLIYRTFILTGLRLNELRTLTVGNLELTPGAEGIQLERRNEKSGAGSTLPLRADLADEVRQWIADKRLTPTDRLFAVPARLVRILARDLRDAGIPKKDDRGRVLDVHALRVSFATHLSTTGTAPRTAQAAMRHSDIKLTVGVYTDPRFLEVRHALDRLPAFGPAATSSAENRDQKRDQLRDPKGQSLAIPGKMGGLISSRDVGRETVGNTGNCNEKTPVTNAVITGVFDSQNSNKVAAVGFEPTTSRL